MKLKDGYLQCLTDEQFELYVAGRLSAEDARNKASHLDCCARCRRRLAIYEANERALQDLRDLMESDPLRPFQQPLPHDSIAGYEIMQEIHRGGQGVVYQAIQKSTRRMVAIKVMKEGPFAGRHDRHRFDREVQILAGLKHAGIVTIHDSGTYPGGFYFVMDYISGTTLNEWLPAAPRDQRVVLELFARICEAVNAAHLSGVIHRDLKPTNIRVDEEGRPHVLDFGLAKMSPALSGTASADAMTLTGQFVGSLPYASPEQADGRINEIDMRTDVYALGVILFQVLTGQYPYAVYGNVRDVVDNILQADPPRPSAIQPTVDDELDTIALKCLSKERERRYQTAGELARDLRHYLAGEPIEAKRDSGIYILKKMIRRYRWPAAIVMGFVVLLAISLTVTTWLYWQAQGARSAEAQARVSAESAEVQARHQARQLRRQVYLNRIALAQNARDAHLPRRVHELLNLCPADLRGWEWYALLWQSDQSSMSLGGHTGFISEVVVPEKVFEAI